MTRDPFSLSDRRQQIKQILKVGRGGSDSSIASPIAAQERLGLPHGGYSGSSS